jgi:hypothetical protein
VAGGANNPLSSEKAAQILHQRGILYVPAAVAATPFCDALAYIWRQWHASSKVPVGMDPSNLLLLPAAAGVG